MRRQMDEMHATYNEKAAVVLHHLARSLPAFSQGIRCSHDYFDFGFNFNFNFNFDFDFDQIKDSVIILI